MINTRILIYGFAFQERKHYEEDDSGGIHKKLCLKLISSSQQLNKKEKRTQFSRKTLFFLPYLNLFFAPLYHPRALVKEAGGIALYSFFIISNVYLCCIKYEKYFHSFLLVTECC